MNESEAKDKNFKLTFVMVPSRAAPLQSLIQLLKKRFVNFQAYASGKQPLDQTVVPVSQFSFLHPFLSKDPCSFKITGECSSSDTLILRIYCLFL